MDLDPEQDSRRSVASISSLVIVVILSVSDVIIAYPVSKSSSASKANPLDFEGSVWKEVGDMIKESDSKKSYANNKL